MIELKVIRYTNANAIEATWVENGRQLFCRAYDATQMQMFRDDVAVYGGDVAAHEALIAQVEAAYEPPAGPTAEDLRAALIAQATAIRWEKETGGVTLPGGVQVGTTIDDQNRITNVIANASLAGAESVDFKAESGWVTLSIDELKGIAATIARHVQDCFTQERAHHEAIQALADEDLAAYDVTVGWPT